MDVLLVEWKMAPSRAKAQQLIAAGAVELKVDDVWQTVDRPSHLLSQEFDSSNVRFKPETEILKYVSRGGLKLAAALESAALNVQGFRCLDVGQSTGGFSDCLLQHGAIEVMGFDVGKGQLDPKLKSHASVRSIEELHIRDLSNNSEVMGWIHSGVDLCVIDLSFISLTEAISELSKVLPVKTKLLALVKPQFELQRRDLNKQGLVRDPSKYDEVRVKILRWLDKCGFKALGYFPCAIRGQDGNQEFFVMAELICSPTLGLSGD